MQASLRGPDFPVRGPEAQPDQPALDVRQLQGEGRVRARQGPGGQGGHKWTNSNTVERMNEKLKHQRIVLRKQILKGVAVQGSGL